MQCSWQFTAAVTIRYAHAAVIAATQSGSLSPGPILISPSPSHYGPESAMASLGESGSGPPGVIPSRG